MLSAVRGGLSAPSARDFDVGVRLRFLLSAASATLGSKGSSLDDARSWRARMEARLDARWISSSSSALSGFSPVDSSRNSVLI
jgi:hypothetical protein